MISLTFIHGRDVFQKNEWKVALKRMFPSIRFDGFMWGNWYPTVLIPVNEWMESESEFGRTHFAKKVTRCKGEFNVIEMVCLGIRDFDNILEGHPNHQSTLETVQ